MIQAESRCDVADNTGAKEAQVIRVLRGSTGSGKFTRKTAGIGDRVIVTIKKALPNGEVKEHDIANAVIVRSKYPTRRPDGSYVRFDNNAVVIIDDNPTFRA